MKPAFKLFYTGIIAMLIFACKPSVTVEKKTSSDLLSEEMTYDSTLAAKVGADQYGMKKYVMAFLKTGPNKDLDSTEAAELQKAHLENIFRMADEGKLAVAGPFLDDSDFQGVYIFNVTSLEEAQALVESDPAVQAGRFALELHPWYGSAAVSMIADLHKKFEKKSVLADK